MGSGLGACVTAQDELLQADVAFHAADYGETLRWIHAVEKDVADLSGPEQTQYFYLRGMSELRLERRGDGLYFLELAETSQHRFGGLDERRLAALRRALPSPDERNVTRVDEK